jgi:chromate transport protein ChrA
MEAFIMSAFSFIRLGSVNFGGPQRMQVVVRMGDKDTVDETDLS